MGDPLIEQFQRDGQAIAKLLQGYSFLQLMPAEALLKRTIADLTSPLQIMVMGEFSTGKSTFINALLGTEVTVVNALPTTAVITKLAYATEEHIVVHFLDGTTREVPIQEFVSMTAETEAAGQGLREHIHFVERMLPAPVLKDINIIDSPGLNALKEIHTKTTKEFVSRADVIFWMFAADRAGSETEIHTIVDLEPRLMPIALVNKMDTLDEEEDDPDELIQNLKRKLSGKVRDVIPLSAQMAFTGKQAGAAELLRESNIAAVERIIAETIVPQSAVYKADGYLERMALFVQEVYDRIMAYRSVPKSSMQQMFSILRKDEQTLWKRMGEQMRGLLAYADQQASHGHAGACLLLGLVCMYALGSCVQSRAKVEYYLKTAAAQGSLPAQALLALYALYAEDQQTAQRWAELAAGRTVSDAALLEMQGMAQYVLGALAMRRGDQAEGIDFYRAAAVNGLPAAAYMFGRLLQHGIGMLRNPSLALSWYRYDIVKNS